MSNISSCPNQVERTIDKKNMENVQDFRKTIEQRIEEYKSKNISFILFEIYEKRVKGEWQLTQVLIEKQTNEIRRQHHQSREKSDQYRSTGNVSCVSAETFLSLAGAFFGNGQIGSILTATGQGLGHSRQLLVSDRRALRVTLIENNLQRSNTFLNEVTHSKQTAEAGMQKALDQQIESIRRAQEQIRAIFAG